MWKPSLWYRKEKVPPGLWCGVPENQSGSWFQLDVKLVGFPSALSVGFRGKDTNQVNVLRPSSICSETSGCTGGVLSTSWEFSDAYQRSECTLSRLLYRTICSTETQLWKTHVTGTDHIVQDNRKTSESWDRAPARRLRGEVSNTRTPRTEPASGRGGPCDQRAAYLV